jgi:hypothetical protein
MKTIEYWRERLEDATNKRFFADSKFRSLELSFKYMFAEKKLRRIHGFNANMSPYGNGLYKLEGRRLGWLVNRRILLTGMATHRQESAKQKRREEFAKLQIARLEKTCQQCKE